MATGLRDSVFEQLDLFSGAGVASSGSDAGPVAWAPLDPTRLSNAELIAVLPRARQNEASGLVQEAVRRGLQAAVPALEALCRRFSGFGLDRAVTEQTAALRSLASLGGGAATEAVTRLIAAASVRGPGLHVALEAAAALGCRLPPDQVAGFLRDNDPVVREAACGCARGGAEVIAALIDLLSDLHPTITQAAGLALGGLGRREGGAVLRAMLRTAPSEVVIRAVARIAEEDDWVRLGQTAARFPELTEAVLEQLEESEVPRAAAVAAGIRRRSGKRS